MNKRVTYNAINKVIAPDELVKGDGYHYFVINSDNKIRETTSVPVCFLSDLTLDQWMAEYAEIKASGHEPFGGNECKSNVWHGTIVIRKVK